MYHEPRVSLLIPLPLVHLVLYTPVLCAADWSVWGTRGDEDVPTLSSSSQGSLGLQPRPDYKPLRPIHEFPELFPNEDGERKHDFLFLLLLLPLAPPSLGKEVAFPLLPV